MKRLYVMIAPALPYRHKIGIAQNAEKRRRSIDRTVSGSVWKIWLVLPVNAKRLESRMHKILAVWNAPIKKQRGKTNGETEWFWTFNLITAFGLWLFVPKYWWLALLPVPFDTVITITVLWLWGWVVRAGIAAGILFIIYNLLK